MSLAFQIRRQDAEGHLHKSTFIFKCVSWLNITHYVVNHIVYRASQLPRLLPKPLCNSYYISKEGIDGIGMIVPSQSQPCLTPWNDSR